MNDDFVHCYDEIEHEIHVYWGLVWCSLGLTIFNFFVSKCMRSRTERSYRLVSRLFVVTGVIKCVFGGLLISVLLPTCPADCTCSQAQIGHFSYGYVAIAFGLLWLHRAFIYHQRAAVATVESAMAYGDVAMSKSVTTAHDDDNPNIV